MSDYNQEYKDVADKLENYRDYGNPPGLNDLLEEAAELIRNSEPKSTQEDNS